MGKPELPTNQQVKQWAKGFFAALGSEWVILTTTDDEHDQRSIAFYQARNEKGYTITLALVEWMHRGGEITVRGDWPGEGFRAGEAPKLPLSSSHKAGQAPEAVAKRLKWLAGWLGERDRLSVKLEALSRTEAKAEAHNLAICEALGEGRPSSMNRYEWSFYGDNMHGRGRVTPCDPPHTQFDITVDSPELALEICALLARHKQTTS
jgi:hypothetical protein